MAIREPSVPREGRIAPAPTSRRLAPAPARASAPRSFPDALRAGFVRTAARSGVYCLERPLEALGGIVVVCVAGYVSLNALGFQDGRHPAPILPKPKPVAARPAPQAVKERARPDTAAAANPATPQQDASAALARLVTETTASVTPRADRDVLQAQKALGKLGYGPVKDDGLMGPGTKAALVKFERAHKLPVTGEANGRTLKELAALAARKR